MFHHLFKSLMRVFKLLKDQNVNIYTKVLPCDETGNMEDEEHDNTEKKEKNETYEDPLPHLDTKTIARLQSRDCCDACLPIVDPEPNQK